jgi:hypothetical protein
MVPTLFDFPWDVGISPFDGQSGNSCELCHTVVSRIDSRMPQREMWAPGESWRPPSDNELSAALQPKTRVKIFRIAPEILVALKKLCPSYGTVEEKVIAQKLPYLTSPIAAGFWFVEPGLTTTTVSSAERDGCQYTVGLHVDSWDRLPINSRDTASWRICVNLGPSARHFMFLPHKVSTLAKQLDYYPPTTDELVSRYLRTTSSPVVARILIKPGEAYLAPTENIIHDGSSAGFNVGTWTWTVRGVPSYV